MRNKWNNDVELFEYETYRSLLLIFITAAFAIIGYMFANWEQIDMEKIQIATAAAMSLIGFVSWYGGKIYRYIDNNKKEKCKNVI